MLTESSAMKIFGHTHVIGEILNLVQKGNFIISGVIKDYPKQSHLQFEALFSYSTIASLNEQIIWKRENREVYTTHYNYVLLKPGIEREDLAPVLDKIASGMDTESNKFGLWLEPVADTMASGTNLQIGPSFERNSQLFFLFLALLILMLACFNYANLMLARSLKRSKEIGLRKVVGGSRRDIFCSVYT